MDHPSQEWFLQNQDSEVLDLQIYPPARVRAAILLVSIICELCKLVLYSLFLDAST